MSEKQSETATKSGTDHSVLGGVETSNKNLENIGVELLPVHTEGTVHAKRIPGTFRKIKWILASFWLILFVGPYLRWDGHQAILWDLANRQFHFFGLTILPQDIWILAMILLFFALLLAASTAVAGRLWCGYFCFHTVWTDVFTWLEEKFEGQPNKRQKLDQAPMSLEKLKVKIPKHLIWLLIGFATSFSFVAYFTDAIDLWARLFAFEWGSVETTIVVVLGLSTYFFAGFLREQTCIGFCPYARIQGAMIDTQTVVPTYDQDRGEPRGRMRRVKPGEEAPDLGDCIDCNLCVAVCPTGVDIRLGQQFGCITCGLCIDACDSVMDKIKKPRGLIRYASLQEFTGKKLPAIWKRPRVIVYSAIMTFAAGAILYGLATMSPIDVKALHERSPLFVQMSNGSIQNKWTLKVVNKGAEVMQAKITIGSEFQNMEYDVSPAVLSVQPGTVGSATLLVRIPRRDLTEANTPIDIMVEDVNNPQIKTTYNSVFIGPKPR
ncbi:cytochrome c oxidase accessory protein CcoG [Thiomicrorhabdus xiamenensis]|uniref:Cytochrome c oxidase accessory protein CcoG n=1 Tax=Thiomicrorhabdus xiamenensis TaxID=2739063 RepID=A0A7D4NPN5_9GAMM|nr:cytochrome c oxidase accessory protein CcoG [Thiomicrorhabdus xiamenensis]QKI88257.1 cytochrome c oxidase accessory protein CcoG [Thiomicrorhabdus xiamenensis]